MPFQQTIQPENKFFDLRLKEIWRYRDLLMLFVRRDFVAKYKQTILGPLWLFIRPLFQTLTMVVVFERMAKLSTEGVPPILFYLAGTTAWNYFANCLTTTSNTFTANAYIFGKVYFPRVITPLSVIISNLIQFGIGFMLFVSIYIYFFVQGGTVAPNKALLLLPLLIVNMGFMGLGLGMLISASTTKYRDLQNLVSFGVQLLMYASPVIIPLSSVPEKYMPVMLWNPMTGVIETFRYAFLGSGTFSFKLVAYSTGFTIFIFFVGLLVFNKTEKNFMDTV
ncbi:MAG: ABC transporter permease [Bacteroidales bacterium]|nr:ABC transporter permease [Bacteroidales bacterium]